MTAKFSGRLVSKKSNFLAAFTQHRVFQQRIKIVHVSLFGKNLTLPKYFCD